VIKDAEKQDIRNIISRSRSANEATRDGVRRAKAPKVLLDQKHKEDKAWGKGIPKPGTLVQEISWHANAEAVKAN
jgi:hypothetical protein